MMKLLNVKSTETHPSGMLLSEFSKLGEINRRLVDTWNTCFEKTIDINYIPAPSYVLYIEMENGITASQAILSGMNVALKEYKLADRSTFQVYSVCTLPEYRKRGFCKSIMINMLELVKKLQVSLLLTVDVNNTIAVDLYRKVGFESVGMVTEDGIERHVMRIDHAN